MSFDPIQDSINTNITEQTQGQLQTAGSETLSPNSVSSLVAPSSLSPLLNPPDHVSAEKKTKISDLLSDDTELVKSGNEGGSLDNTATANPPLVSEETATDLASTLDKKNVKRKKKSIGKESLKELDQKESKNYQTLLINSRSRHLKKNDGEPYWRKEIQFQFLIGLFFNNKRVFRNPFFGSPDGFDWPEHFKFFKNDEGELIENNGEYLTFFELYLVTLLKSNKISKILKDRLMLDINYALNFVIICLLVNIGRLNTTVNFDHEMKSQFRTYHSIPSLQVGDHLHIIEKYYQIQPNSIKLSKDEEETANIRGGSGYTMSTVKQLQDTPRIKSILKSINDLNLEIPKNFKEFIFGMSDDNKYDLNIISLIFLLCVHEFEIGKVFFPNQEQLTNDEIKAITDSGAPMSSGSLFNDIWLRPEISPINEVNRFLWLIYLFKETNFKVDLIFSNPFNSLSSENVTLDPATNIAEKITTGDQTVTQNLRLLVPEIKYLSESETNGTMQGTDDIDTPQEVELANQMKLLRSNFVDDEQQVSSGGEGDLAQKNGKAISSGLGKAVDGSKNMKQKDKKVKGKDLKKKDEVKVESSEGIYDEDSQSALLASSESPDARKKKGKKPVKPTKAPKTAKVTAESKKRKLNSNDDQSSAHDDSLDDQDHADHDQTTSTAATVLEKSGNSKKKRKKLTDLPVKLNTTEIEALLNADIKSGSNSRNTINKKIKNRLLAAFLKDLLSERLNEQQKRRLRVGNLKSLDKIAKSLLLTQNYDSDEVAGATEDVANRIEEFKVSYYKFLTKTCTFMEDLELRNSEGPPPNSSYSFLDEMFVNL